MYYNLRLVNKFKSCHFSQDIKNILSEKVGVKRKGTRDSVEIYNNSSYI